MNHKVLVGLCVATAISLSGCHTVATLTGSDTKSLMLKGDQYFSATVSEARAKGELDTSSATYRRINTVFNKMIPYADQENKTGAKFNWKLAVVKSEELNAMVAPGGKVIFYTGIVDKLKLSNEEIAAIMGHEMTHALEEHSKSSAGAETLTKLGLKVAISQFGLGNSAAQIADLASELGVTLPYSRSLEQKADKGGMKLMAMAGYNPTATTTVWKKMSEANGKESKLLSLLSTHPSDNARIAAAEKHLPEMMAIYQQRKGK